MLQEDILFILIILVPLFLLGTFCISLGVLIVINQKIRSWWGKWWSGYLEKKERENMARFFTAPLVIITGLMALYTAFSILWSI